MIMDSKVNNTNKDWLEPVSTSMAKLHLVQSHAKKMMLSNESSVRPSTRKQSTVAPSRSGQALRSTYLSKQYSKSKDTKHVRLLSPCSGDSCYTQEDNRSFSELFTRPEQDIYNISNRELQPKINTTDSSSPDTSQCSATNMLFAKKFYNDKSSVIMFKQNTTALKKQAIEACFPDASDGKITTSVIEKPTGSMQQATHQPIHICLPSIYNVRESDEDLTLTQRMLSPDDYESINSMSHDKSDQNVKDTSVSIPESVKALAADKKTVTFYVQKHNSKSKADLNLKYNNNRKPTTQSMFSSKKLDIIDNLTDDTSTSDDYLSLTSIFDDLNNKYKEKDKTSQWNNISEKTQYEKYFDDLNRNHVYTRSDNECNSYKRTPVTNCDIASNEPLGCVDCDTKPDSKALPHANVKIREDKNVVFRITPRGNRRRISQKTTVSGNSSLANSLVDCKSDTQNNGSLSKLEHSAKTSEANTCISECKDNNTSNNEVNMHYLRNKYNGDSIPTVTINYDDDDCKKSSYFAKKVNKDFEPVRSHQSMVEIQNSYIDTRFTSSKEKNFHELSLPKVSHNVFITNTSETELFNEKRNAPSLFKTTKTIEFHPTAMQDVTSKTVIQAAMKKISPKKSVSHHPYVSPTHSVGSCSNQSETKDQHFKDRVQKVTEHTDKLFTHVYTPTRIKQFNKNSENSSVLRRVSSASKLRCQTVTDEVNDHSKYGLIKEKFKQNLSKNVREVKSANSALRTKTDRLASKASKKKNNQAAVTQTSDYDVAEGVRALESAILSSSGRSKYKHATGFLPCDPSYGLIPHYKHWLSEDYAELQMIKERLADDKLHRLKQRKQVTQRIKKLPV